MHVDKKFDRDVWTGPLKALKSELEARRRPRDKGGQLLFDSVFDLRWASWSMIEPTLYVMERVLRPDAPPWDLCVHRARRRRAARGADDAEALRAALSRTLRTPELGGRCDGKIGPPSACRLSFTIV